MKLLILCLILSVILAVSCASPHSRQVKDSAESSESSELTHIYDKNLASSSSSSEEDGSESDTETEAAKVYKESVENEKHLSQDNEKDDSSLNSNEELNKNNIINEIDSLEEDNEILETKTKQNNKNKRSVKYEAHKSNLLANDSEDVIQYYKTHKSALENNENKFGWHGRLGRSVDSFQENDSSEEQKKPQQHSVAVANSTAPKPEEKPTEAQTARRSRNTDVASTEEDVTDQERDVNEVFIFSNEKQQNFMENGDLNSLEQETVLNEDTKNSAEDYAQGCGGSSNNKDDDVSNESNSNETNLD